jgi:hypothetical protein
VLQLLLNGADKLEALGTEQCVCPVGKAIHTLISMPPATFVECKQGEHSLRWRDIDSLVGGVLRCHKWRLTEDDLTGRKALHVQMYNLLTCSCTRHV